MIDVQPTSCSTLSAAKNRQPMRPKLSSTVPMALRPVRPPMSPAKKNIAQPMTCPSRMASRPLVKPRGAKYVPVRISAMDTAAPNQMRPFWKLDVFFIFRPPDGIRA